MAESKLTPDQAAEYILRHFRDPMFKDYRRRCLGFWRGLWGDEYADKVASLVRAAWRSR